MVARCPYCASGSEFLIMSPHLQGGFICDRCEHTVRPDVEGYRCICRKCVQTEQFSHLGSQPWAKRRLKQTS